MRDVVDSVDFSPLRSRDRSRNRRRGEGEMPRRLSEGKSEGRHEVNRRRKPQGGDPTPAV